MDRIIGRTGARDIGTGRNDHVGHGVKGMAFLAEASPQIGTGHVAECVCLRRVAKKAGLNSVMVLNESGEFAIKKHKGIQILPDMTPSSLADFCRKNPSTLFVTNFRRVSEEQVNALAESGALVACIDELGGTRLSCDLLFNGSIVEEWHRYTSNNPRFRAFFGPAYFPMAEAFGRLSRTRHFTGPASNILVTLGGVDPTGATLRILDYFLTGGGNRGAAQINVVLGSGFSHAGSVAQRIDRINEMGIHLHQSLPSLVPLLAQADVVFTAGGDTLYEAACLGTPAIVLWADDHQRIQAESFSRQGFGRVLGHGAEVALEDIEFSLRVFDDPLLRNDHSRAGRALVDGRGAERIIHLLRQTLL